MLDGTFGMTRNTDNISNLKSFFNNIIIPEIKFLNKSRAPNATATPNNPNPAITGPIFIPTLRVQQLFLKNY